MRKKVTSTQSLIVIDGHCLWHGNGGITAVRDCVRVVRAVGLCNMKLRLLLAARDASVHMARDSSRDSPRCQHAFPIRGYARGSIVCAFPKEDELLLIS